MSLFVKVPLLWANELARIGASGSIHVVAHELLYQARWSKNVKLTTARLEALGVSRRSKWRALNELSRAGLIHVEERGNKNPIVAVRFLG
jgi:hypothetical protein